MPAPERPGLRLTRRAALVSVAAVGLVGCTPERGLDRRRREEDPAPVEPRVDPDVAVAAEVLAAESAVLALVRATVERHPALADRLDPVAATHEAHTALLDDAVPEEATAAPSPSASGPAPGPAGEASPTASGSPAAPAAPAASVSPSPGDPETAVPRNARRALRQVAAAEQDLATRTKQQAFKAQSGAFARVLGSMAASAAQHAVLLGPTAEGGAS